MRTKTAVLTAALVAAGALSSMAQNVYSVNVVGYVNVPVQANKFYLIANPLDKASVSGGNNITNAIVLNDTFDQTQVFPWTGSGYGDAEQYIATYGWYPGTTVLKPGAGFFIFPTTNSTITFTGEVKVGDTNTLPGGFTLTGSTFPAALDLTTLGLTGGDQDQVFRFSPTTHSYLPAVQYIATYGWYDTGLGDGGPVNGPTLNVAEGFFYYNANAPFSWKQNFVIQ